MSSGAEVGKDDFRTLVNSIMRCSGDNGHR